MCSGESAVRILKDLKFRFNFTINFMIGYGNAKRPNELKSILLASFRN